MTDTIALYLSLVGTCRHMLILLMLLLLRPNRIGNERSLHSGHVIFTDLVGNRGKLEQHTILRVGHLHTPLLPFKRSSILLRRISSNPGIISTAIAQILLK